MPRNGAVEPTAHQHLHLLSSPAIVLEKVVIIHHDWIELRLLDTAIDERWILDPFVTSPWHIMSRRAQPPRIVGPAAKRIAERFLPAVVQAIKAEIADHCERSTWSCDECHEEALRDYHRQFAHGLSQLLAELLTDRDGRSV